MNKFARFDENPAMTLRDIKKQNITDGRTHARTHGQRENSIPTTNKVCGGYNNLQWCSLVLFFKMNSKARIFLLVDLQTLQL